MLPAVLEVERIAKRFGDLAACRDVSFEVRPGEVFGLAGPGGAGKTTTLRIALGMLTPDSGAVRLSGEPVDDAARRRIGYLPAERGLYPRMRVLDQLVYLAELHGRTVNEAHRSAEIWLARLGLRDRRTDRIGRLGLGDQQRVQLAAALAHDPDVLVLDEPFAGLDPAATETLGSVLRERAAAGAAVLFSSDQLDLAERLCDRVGVIHNGRMVAVGSIGELRSGGRCELVVDAPNAGPGWAAELAGVEVLGVHNGLTRLALADGVDDQVVLAAALATGPVREFTRVRPSLADVYRDAVGAE